MNRTHNGVLIPEELAGASTRELDAYAAEVKAGNRAFVNAFFALEDAARARGLDVDALEQHEPTRLFAPAPDVIPGQLGLGG
jgi:hypothetical protein